MATTKKSTPAQLVAKYAGWIKENQKKLKAAKTQTAGRALYRKIERQKALLAKAKKEMKGSTSKKSVGPHGKTLAELRSAARKKALKLKQTPRRLR